MSETSAKNPKSLLQRIFGSSSEPRPSPVVKAPANPIVRRLRRPKRPGPPPGKPIFSPERQSRSILESAPVERRLEGVTTWAYQLQNQNVAAVAACAADVVVIDPTPDGGEYFARSQVDTMRRRPGAKDKVLIAYMSIGEAEEGRFYWKPSWAEGPSTRRKLTRKAPPWLDAQNDGGWRDNYKVKYWDKDWQSIILGDGDSAMNRIIASGFDGVYLDIIDAYDYYQKKGRATAPAEMVDFVVRIAREGRKRNPNFYVIPQNGEGLLEDAVYRSYISAIGKEDILFYQPEDMDINDQQRVVRNSADTVRSVTETLEQAKSANIPVLSVEYLRDDTENRKLIGKTTDEVRKLGYVPYFGDRHLTKLFPIISPAAKAGNGEPMV